MTDKGSKVTETVEGTAWACRSPQTFKVELLTKALEAAQKKKLVLRDEAEALSLVKGELHVVPATRPVIRITGPRDLVLADYLLRH
jgi:2-C-methyl-D-erythritol 4-phosphate cytidylyltransferase